MKKIEVTHSAQSNRKIQKAKTKILVTSRHETKANIALKGYRLENIEKCTYWAAQYHLMDIERR